MKKAANGTSKRFQETALERLDREWAKEREKYYLIDDNGNQTQALPSKGASIALGLIAVIFGVVCLAAAFGARGGNNSPVLAWLLPLIGIFMLFFGIWASRKGVQKAQAYKEAEAAYQQRRAEIQAGDVR